MPETPETQAAMVWVRRSNGRPFGHVYRSVREGGRVRSVYVGPELSLDAEAALAEWEWHDRVRRREARESRHAARQALAARLKVVDELSAGADLAAVAGGLLRVVGFHNPGRKGWRAVRGALKRLRAEVGRVGEAVRRREQEAKSQPLMRLTATPTDPDMVTLFQTARAGDPAALARLPGYIRERGLAGRFGDLGRFAEGYLVGRAAGDDPVLRAAVEAKVAELWTELAGPDPTALELLLVRRCVNAWLGTHVAEIEAARAADPKERDALDRLLTRGQRRLTEAMRELAVVRRLEAPAAFRRAAPLLLPVPACRPPTCSPPDRR